MIDVRALLEHPDIGKLLDPEKPPVLVDGRLEITTVPEGRCHLTPVRTARGEGSLHVVFTDFRYSVSKLQSVPVPEGVTKVTCEYLNYDALYDKIASDVMY